jgi:arylsulfatase A-like enzyme
MGKRFLFIIILVGTVSAVAEDERPNIVLIVADDLGYADLGCYGNRVHRTPNIDRLAAGGLRFTDFHSNGSMCTPTRAAMLTGLYQNRFGRKFESAISGRFNRDHGLPLEAVTIAEVLQEQGYATGMFGKWHLGYIPPWLPPDQGFDEFRGLGAGDGDHHTHIDRWGREDWWKNNEVIMEEGYTADLLTKHSIDFLERHQDEPFFLYVPHLAIHFPWQGPNDPPHRRKGVDYNDDKWGIIDHPENVAPHVKAMVESLDDSVGQITAALERLNLDENTLVIFTSDNGGYLNYGRTFKNISSNGSLRGQKTSIYEGGHRVPMIFYWPDRIRAGVSDVTSLSMDLFPTIASVTKTSIENMEQDGVNIGNVLFRNETIPERTFYWRQGDEWAVRLGAWKLDVIGKRVALYNLDDDLAEQKNLAKEFPGRVEKMTAAWKAWAEDVDTTAATFEK